jgi:uncharacterized membrane protein (UPF0127 family)
MNRYIYLGALIVVGSVLTFFFYRTPSPREVVPIESVPDATFGGVSLKLEYATTTLDQEKGLGGRASLPEKQGMLFVFENNARYGFWMKDTRIPLDIFWLDSDRRVISLAESVATSTYPNVFYPSRPARYVLETNAGFARAHGIATGTLLYLKNPEAVLQ